MINNKTHLIIAANLTSLDISTTTSSSQNYELSLANALSSYVDHISIVSHIAEKIEKRSNIMLYPVKKQPTAFCTYYDRAIKDNHLLKDDENNVILFWGYNPITIISLCKLKKHAKIVSFVYDTHYAAIDDMPTLKKTIFNVFFSWGLKIINKVNGVLLFQKAAANEMKLKNPFLVTLPFVDNSLIKDFKPTGNNVLRFLYAGTLCTYNCIHELVDAAIMLPQLNIEIDIMGDGQCTDYVKSAERKDLRIHYYGRLPKKEMDDLIQKADILLNIRQLDSVVSKYAFPSKLIEYMQSGKPVLSTGVIDSPLFNESAYVIKSNTVKSICDKIMFIYQNQDTMQTKVESSKLYLQKYHDQSVIIKKIYTFLFKKLFNQI